MTNALKILEDGYPLDAENCLQCEERAVIKMDGRLICLACGAADINAQQQDKKMTYTYVVMEVSNKTFKEIKEKLEEAEYPQCY